MLQDSKIIDPPRQVLEDWDPIGIKENLRRSILLVLLKESIKDFTPEV